MCGVQRAVDVRRPSLNMAMIELDHKKVKRLVWVRWIQYKRSLAFARKYCGRN
jgi:hypothetical protein